VGNSASGGEAYDRQPVVRAEQKKLEPSMELLQSYAFGSMPSDADVSAALNIWAQSNLRDPHSAVISIASTPRKGWGRHFGSSGDFHFGWRFSADINAKNGFGGYVGVQRHEFILSDGVAIQLSYAGNLRGVTMILNGDNGFVD
jgi:hypothetical protein